MRFTFPSPIMGEAIVEGITSEETAIRPSCTATEPMPEEEGMLAEEIRQLRAVLAESKQTARTTRGEVKAIKGRLKGRLHELKRVRCFASTLPRLKRKLTTPGLAYDFVRWCAGSFGLPHEMRDDGILVLDPAAKPAEQATDSAMPPAGGQEAAVSYAGGHDVA